MARYSNDFDDEREIHTRHDRFSREQPWNYGRAYSGGRLENDSGRPDIGRGRFGERADYDRNERSFNEYGDQYGREDYRRPSYDGRDRSSQAGSEGVAYQPRSRYDERISRSRLHIRDIMTRELAVSTRDTTLHEVAGMMKHEDVGVIPVVDLPQNGGNGKTSVENRRLNTSSYSYGKLAGLITDRDIVLRAVAESKDCNAIRAEEVMSTDVHTARPHERVVDVIRKMGDKQVRRIPVVNENGNLLGIVSMGDIAVETESDRELAEALEDISRESSFWRKLFN
jgi:CBS domain-containing protein